MIVFKFEKFWKFKRSNIHENMGLNWAILFVGIFLNSVVSFFQNFSCIWDCKIYLLRFFFKIQIVNAWQLILKIYNDFFQWLSIIFFQKLSNFKIFKSQNFDSPKFAKILILRNLQMFKMLSLSLSLSTLALSQL